MATNVLNYQTLVKHLAQGVPVGVEPARLHGVMCGWVCASDALRQSFPWMEMVSAAVEEPKLFQEKRQVLLQLYTQISDQFFHDDTFFLMLPTGRQSILSQARALTDWCYGFMQGLGLTGRPFLNELNDDMRSAVLNIFEISQIDFEQVHTTRQDGKSYREILGYIRSAALSIYKQLNISTMAFPVVVPEDSTHTVH